MLSVESTNRPWFLGEGREIRGLIAQDDTLPNYRLKVDRSLREHQHQHHSPESQQ